MYRPRWCYASAASSDRKNCTIGFSRAHQGQVDHIVNTYSGLVTAGKEKFQADPFVIALAKVGRYTVITEETGIGSLGKIPGVCNAMKVECINLMQLIDAEDWVLG